MKHILFTFTILMASLSVSNAHAHEEIERENLSLFVKEIDFLIDEVDRMKQLSSKDARMMFDYESLKADLRSMRRGISGYINKDINDGRPIKLLKGSY